MNDLKKQKTKDCELYAAKKEFRIQEQNFITIESVGNLEFKFLNGSAALMPLMENSGKLHCNGNVPISIISGKPFITHVNALLESIKRTGEHETKPTTLTFTKPNAFDIIEIGNYQMKNCFFGQPLTFNFGAEQ